jgi:hypothetical protein
MTKSQRTIERLDGRGNIRFADGAAVNVSYSLVVFQTVDDDADTSQQVGQLEIKGALEVGKDQGLVDLGGKPFTLKTGDSRCLEASAYTGDPVSRQWQIVMTAGSKGLTAC